jgi:hypothetical protein
VRVDSPTSAPGRTRRADRIQTWVLVGSAFVLGLVLGATAFVGAWRVSARQGDRANAARALADHRLHEAQTRSATLSRRLHRAKAGLAVARRKERQLRVVSRNAARQASRSGWQAARDEKELLALRHQASKVTSDAAALEAYVRATPSQALDGGFLLTQLQYLSAAARRLQAR